MHFKEYMYYFLENVQEYPLNIHKIDKFDSFCSIDMYIFIAYKIFSNFL